MEVNRKEKRGEGWRVRREVIKSFSQLEMAPLIEYELFHASERYLLQPAGKMAGKLTDCREMKIFHDTKKLCVRKEQQVGKKVID